MKVYWIPPAKANDEGNIAAPSDFSDSLSVVQLTSLNEVSERIQQRISILQWFGLQCVFLNQCLSFYPCDSNLFNEYD